MSKKLEDFNDTDFMIGEIVSFDHRGVRLKGTVVRAYNSRLIYHVQVNGDRYEVEVGVDDPRRET